MQKIIHGTCSLLFLLLCLAAPPVSAQASSESTGGLALFFGIELIELQQNNFQNLGPDNLTGFIGFSLPHQTRTLWGLRYQFINVDLSEAHLQEPSPAFLGDFSGVSGHLQVQRLYLDYYYNWDFSWLTIQPIVSLGLGYNSWSFYNSLTTEDYSLQALSFGIGGRFRFTLFSLLFVEIPAIDGFVYLWKSRTPEAWLGEAHLNFNPYAGLFNWIFIGCNISL